MTELDSVHDRHKNQALARQIYFSLKQQILRNQLEIGQKLNTVNLARQYNVSRTPVSAAIDMLVRDGLVNREIGKQAEVMPPSRDEIRRIYSYRLLLEPFAAGEALPYVNTESLAELRQELLAMKQAPYSRETAMAFDQKLHAIFWESLPSPSTEIIYKAIQNCSIRVQALAIYILGDKSHNNNEEHLKILDAALSGNPEKTAEAVHFHISNTFQNVLHYFDNMGK